MLWEGMVMTIFFFPFLFCFTVERILEGTSMCVLPRDLCEYIYEIVLKNLAEPGKMPL